MGSIGWKCLKRSHKLNDQGNIPRRYFKLNIEMTIWKGNIIDNLDRTRNVFKRYEQELNRVLPPAKNMHCKLTLQVVSRVNFLIGDDNLIKVAKAYSAPSLALLISYKGVTGL